jgi:hypothetical protein
VLWLTDICLLISPAEVASYQNVKAVLTLWLSYLGQVANVEIAVIAKILY